MAIPDGRYRKKMKESIFLYYLMLKKLNPLKLYVYIFSLTSSSVLLSVLGRSCLRQCLAHVCCILYYVEIGSTMLCVLCSWMYAALFCDLPILYKQWFMD